MNIDFCGQVPKDAGYPGAIEDVFRRCIPKKRVVLCDGASESFDSQTWARILANRFIRDNSITDEWLRESCLHYSSHHNLDALSWSKRAAYDRGSYSSILGISQIADDTIRVVAVGDTTAFLLAGDELRGSFPYSVSAEYQQHPVLIGTTSNQDSTIVTEVEWTLDFADPSVLCMTDALAQWALSLSEAGHPVWAALARWAERQDLATLVGLERSSRRMRVDDVTLVRLSFTSGG